MFNLKIGLPLATALLVGLTTAARASASVPTKPLDSEGIGKFTVQVAAFDDEARAKVFTTDLKTHGYRAFYLPVKIKGRSWFRVGIGLFATETEAKHYRSEVLGKTKLPEAIIRAVD